jgi:hypothetical protein
MAGDGRMAGQPVARAERRWGRARRGLSHPRRLRRRDMPGRLESPPAKNVPVFRGVTSTPLAHWAKGGATATEKKPTNSEGSGEERRRTYVSRQIVAAPRKVYLAALGLGAM